MSNFNENLKEFRKEMGLTQKQLASKINVSEDCIYFWEKGRSEPSITDLINLSRLFKISIDFLVGNTDF